MEQTLSINDSSYYRSKETIGICGDFLTSPEVSQLFGEIIGLWCIEQWQRLKRPKDFNLIEFGSGSGALLQTALKVIKLEAEMIKAVQIQIFDINQQFIKLQKEKLKEYKISWYENFEKINNLPSIVIANEFFDALPIKQYIKKDDNWHEVIIRSNNEHQLSFDSIFTNLKQNDLLNKQYPLALDQAIVEESSQSIKLSHHLALHLKQYGGSALIIDYGYNIEPMERHSSTFLSTLQSIKNHQYVGVFEHIAKADLTAHVDFYRIAEIFKKYGTSQIDYGTQREFLINYGIKLRANRLVALNPDKSYLIKNQLSRLIDLNQMGDLFKVLSVSY